MMLSPILNERLQNEQQHVNFPKIDLENTYERLVKRANDVEPNVAKAKLVKENPIQAAKSYFTDLKNDTKNFFKAVKTGKLNDNSLGRLNDLGLKVGALSIASFLAVNSKTKTEAAMRFIGSGAFFASMSLWPKLFINLPARIVHGFDIGQRYISAQGDKKDFFLDNQFLPWDAYTDEEFAKIGKRTGIDMYSENGKEKIQRKMQKTALQNRTLWMATAGFATPLMTALFCDAVEPHVKDFIINKDFKKAQTALENGSLKEALENIDKNAMNAFQNNSLAKSSINAFFEKNKESLKEDAFFYELGKKLSFVPDNLSKDELKLVEDFGKTASEGEIKLALKNLYDKNTIVNYTDENKGTLRNILTEFYGGCPLDKSGIIDASQILEDMDIFLLDDNQIGDMLDEIENAKKNNSLTFKKLKDVLLQAGNNETADKVLKTLDESGICISDSSKFKDIITEFYTTTTEPTKSKVKLYLEKALNPIAGYKAESKATQYIVDSKRGLLKKLNLDKKALEKVKSGDENETFRVLQNFFENSVKDCKFGSEEYKKVVSDLLGLKMGEDKAPLTDAIEKLKDLLNYTKPKVKDDIKTDTDELLKALSGGDASSLFDSILLKSIKEQETNVNGFLSRVAICTNFESRLKDGLIEVVEPYESSKVNLKDSPELLEHARNIIYRCNQSRWTNRDLMLPKKTFESLVNAIFDKNAFENEPVIVKDTAKKLLEQLQDDEDLLGKINPRTKENYLLNLNLVKQIKNTAIEVTNNKAWKKIFAPAAIALVAVTLLAQPFFGNIKKEYPEKGSKENKTGGGRNV